MTRRTVARTIAVVLVAYLITLWMTSYDRNMLAHYQTMSRDALLADIANRSEKTFDFQFFVAIIIVGVPFCLVNGIAWCAEQVIDRISPLTPLPGQAP